MKTAKSKTRILALLFAGMLIIMSMASYYTDLESFAEDGSSAAETTPTLEIEQSFLMSGQEPGDTDGLTCEYVLKGRTGTEPLPEGAAGEYRFTLTRDDNIEITPVGENAATGADHELVFTEVGEYEYTLTPVHKDAEEGYTYDETEYIIRFYVKNAAGGLECGVTCEAPDGTKPASVSYRHRYEGGLAPVRIDPPLKKIVKGNPPAKATFHFTMKALPEKSNLPDGMTRLPMPRNSTKQSITKAIKGPGEYEFGWITYTEPGTYVYKVFEEKDYLKGYKYDRTIYEVKCVVSQSGNRLVQKTTIKNMSLLGEDGKIVFTNEYKGKDHDDEDDDDDDYDEDFDEDDEDEDEEEPEEHSRIRTGDVANILLWVIIAAASAAILILLLKKHKRSSDQ